MTRDKNGRRPYPAGNPRELYRPLDFVVLRTPLYPVAFYEAMCSASLEDLSRCECLNDERVLSAITAASPELVRALLSPTDKEADRIRAIRKLRRYLIRMSTRPTPFGALAGVAIAPLGERTTLSIDEDTARRCHHLDVPWLLSFAHKLESDPEIFQQLELQANHCAFERAGRVYIRELNPLSKTTGTLKHASLRASRMVTRTLDAARAPIAYEALFRSLAGSMKGMEEKIQQFLTDLWRQEFLLTELRPPFTAGDPARYLLKRLQRLRGSEPYRFELERELAMTDCSSVHAASGRSDLPHAQVWNSEQRKTLVHTDSVFSTTGELNVLVAREAARAAELLLSLTPWPTGLPYIATYRQAFEERYGTDREVPLVEMMDPEYGIGIPPSYEGKKATSGGEQSASTRTRRETLFEIARAANEGRHLEVELDEETLRRLRTWTPSIENLPASLEINVFVSADSTRDLDEGRFSIVLGPNVGAMEGGRSLGRFAGSLGPAGTRAYRDIAQAHETAMAGKLCVELNYLPRNLQLTNILVRPATHQLETSIGVRPGVSPDQVLSVRDLLVGVRGARFYVKSAKHGCPVNICSGHMANIDFAPAICRLLTDLMLDGVAILRDLDWGVAAMHPFLPRVRVGRAVIGVAKWRITGVRAKRKFSLRGKEEFRTALTLWRTEWKVPRHVHLAEADNRLVLDLENDMDIEDLHSELRQLPEDSALTLEEVYPNVADAWLAGSSGRFVTEYVIPLVIHTETTAQPVQSPRSLAAEAIAPAQQTETGRRVKLPGSDWLYVKLYTALSIEDDLLVGPIRELASGSREAGMIERWFFVRYADPQSHIRLRFQGVPLTLSERLLPKVLEWAQDLVKKDLCLRFAIDTYEPEIERYGGTAAIDLAEELFFLDSESVLRLQRFLGPGCPLSRVELAVYGLDFLSKNLGCEGAERRSLFKGIGAPRRESGRAFRERKRVLEALVGLRPERSLGNILDELSRAVEANAEAIHGVGSRFRALDREGRLATPLDAIYRSFAHMHCNRLGLDSANEKLAYGLLTRSYDALQAFSRQEVLSPRSNKEEAYGRSDA
jgi:thiopeptide-type bacteriocin biosynthesis protein